MIVTVKLFAAAKQAVGAAELTVELPPGATVGQLRGELARRAPALAPLLPGMSLALDAEYASDDQLVPPTAEIACIPPVSGG